jgi:hypothetical protein
MVTSEQMEEYRSQGYLITDDTPPDFAELEAASHRVKAKVRSGETDVYTHWANPGEPWCIRGLLAPEFAEPVFAEHLVSQWALGYSRCFIDEPLRLGWIDLRTNPHDEDMPGGWHRDLGAKSIEAAPQELMALLQKPKRNTRWYVALVDDACLQIVPGSHLRPNTPEEQEILANHVHADISTQKTIQLRRGQVLFWDGNTVHRGVMHKDVERLTLAASWAQHSDDDQPVETVDGRFAWRLKESVRAALPATMLPYYDRWRALQPKTA